MILIIPTLIIFNLVIGFMPKRLSAIELFTTSLGSFILQTTVDDILDLQFNWYGYFGKGYNTEALLIFFFIYPQVNILFLNFFPNSSTYLRKIIYILLWSLFSIGYEYLSIQEGYFYYTRWKLAYSAIIYPFLFLLLLLNLRFVQKLLRMARNQS
ncbi:MAG: CBO0543 family protein [Sporolactobacillus sp.]